MPHRLKALYVEDNPDDVTIFEHALRRTGTTLRVVSNGAEAIDYLQGQHGFEDRSQSPFPDVIFLDWRMPLVSGKEFLGWCRRNPLCDSLSLVVLTGSESPEDIHDARAAGANLILAKPNSVQTLSEQLRQILSTIAGRQYH
ncbi:MAG: response regulator [Verrucomicrobiia bacterium]